MKKIGMSFKALTVTSRTLTFFLCLALLGIRAQESTSNATQAHEDDGGNPSTSPTGGNIEDDLDCTFRTNYTFMFDRMTLKHAVDPIKGTVAVELVYEGKGWVAFGASPRGNMVGAEVVIAKPDYPVNGSNPGKYRIASASIAGIELMESQTLLNATFEQTDGRTIVRYTKRLAEAGEIEIYPDDENTFIFAAGSDNTFKYHGQQHGSFSLPRLTKCLAADGSSMDDLVLSGATPSSGSERGFTPCDSFGRTVGVAIMMIAILMNF